MPERRVIFQWLNRSYPDIEFREFPIIIGRTHPPLQAYEEQESKVLHFMSGDHAELFESRDRIWIRNISNNATMVNGRLIEHPVCLQDGDCVEFPKCFRFKVMLFDIDDGEKANADTDEVNAIRNKFSRTMRIEINPEDANGAELANYAQNIKRFGATTKEELKFKDDTLQREHKQRRKLLMLRYLIAGSISILLVFMLLFWLTKPSRWQARAQACFKRGDYESTDKLTEQYIRTISHNNEIVTLWRKSKLYGCAPAWTKLWNENKWNDLRQSVQSVQSQAKELGLKPLKELNFLLWAVDAESYLQPKLPAFRKRLFYDEYLITDLLNRWSDLSKLKLSGENMLKDCPALKLIERTAVSRQRILNSEQSVYVKKVNELNEKLNAALETGNIDAVGKVVKTYKALKTDNFDELDKDFSVWKEISLLIKHHRSLDAVVVIRKKTCQTPLFQTAIQRIGGELQPLQKINETTLVARKQWRDGNLQESIDLLKKLVDQTSDATIQEELVTLKKLQAEHNWLNNNSSSPSSQKRLLRFYQSLHPVQDKWLRVFWVNRYRQKVETLWATTQKYRDEGESFWLQYCKKGKISLSEISSENGLFLEKANLLRKAYINAMQAKNAFLLLPDMIPPEFTKLFDAVNNEVILQRNSLKSMRTLLPESTYKERSAVLSDALSAQAP